MRTSKAYGCGFIAVVACFSLNAQAIGRQNWNQEEAAKRVQSVITQEEANDFRWDKIDWLVDAKLAASRAQAEHKPILLYFFLKGDAGPKAAPC